MQGNNVKDIVQTLVDEGFVISKSEARRLIAGGAVKLGDQTVRHPNHAVTTSQLYRLKVGKKSQEEK